MDTFDTPVAIVLFNRPRRVAELIERLRSSKPRRIFAIADGPRADREGERERCEAARAALDAIDWSCEIVREFAASNLGCDDRLEQGLDWLFDRVDRAIVLEDDIRPSPRFLPWAISMLDRYGDDPDFSIASGHNALGAWGDQDADHLRARRGSIWGWATTARSWRRSRAIDLSTLDAGVDACLGLADLDPLLAEHCRLIVAEARRVRRLAWDTSFSVRTILDGRIAAVSSVNLVENTGIGADATRTTFAGDFVATLPASDRTPVRDGTPGGLDPLYDRRSLMAELLGRCRQPKMAGHLARLLQSNPAAPIDAATRLHLAPFSHPEESIAILDHLAEHGASSRSLEEIRSKLRGMSSAVGSAVHGSDR
ncbi:MAG: hypothetical protein FJ257_00915 [Phycisphaerae bacterium]|nr:hypothetical protein [Phycisphaerae bacterium]